MKNKWINLALEEPEEYQTLLIKIGTQIYHGVRKGKLFFRINPIRSQPCNCVTGHNLLNVSRLSITEWSYPKDQEKLNIIYEDLLSI